MKKILFILVLILSLTGCSRYEPVLEKKNSLTSAAATTFSSSIRDSSTTYSGGGVEKEVEVTFSKLNVLQQIGVATIEENSKKAVAAQQKEEEKIEEPIVIEEPIIIEEPVVVGEQTPIIEEAIEKEEPFIVFKPSTHYIHLSTCHWVNDECYEITDTKDIEARKCSECNPQIEIINKYSEPKPKKESTSIDSYSRQLLAEIVWHEAGSSWISQYNKAKIAAGVMNRVKDSRFPNTVYNVLTAPGQFTGYYPGCCTPTQACYDAVDYYFAHTNEFNSDNSWYGDGYQNYFYYQ